MFCLAVCSSNKRLSLFFFLLGLDTVTSVISCCLPKPAHTQPSVCLDIRDRVLGMFACKYVVSRVCASVLGRVHSLSTDTRLSCDGFWPSGEFLIKVNHVSVSTVAEASGLLFQKALYQMAQGCEEIKILFKTSPGEEYWN